MMNDCKIVNDRLKSFTLASLVLLVSGENFRNVSKDLSITYTVKEATLTAEKKPLVLVLHTLLQYPYKLGLS